MKYWFVKWTVDVCKANIIALKMIMMLNSHRHIKKLQNTTEISILVSNKMVLSIKNAVGRKKLDISIRKVICTLD